MNMLYSPRTNGFYNADIHGSAIPDDVLDVSNEDYDALLLAQSHGATITTLANGRPAAVMPAPRTLDEVKSTLCMEVDARADAAYLAIGVPSPGRLAEYQRAEADAKAFKNARYAGRIPPTISCQCVASGMTPQEAADDIIVTATNWNAALVAIRSARLIGKASVKTAVSEEAAHVEAKAAIAAIREVARTST